MLGFVLLIFRWHGGKIIAVWCTIPFCSIFASSLSKGIYGSFSEVTLD